MAQVGDPCPNTTLLARSKPIPLFIDGVLVPKSGSPSINPLSGPASKLGSEQEQCKIVR